MGGPYIFLPYEGDPLALPCNEIAAVVGYSSSVRSNTLSLSRPSANAVSEAIADAVSIFDDVPNDVASTTATRKRSAVKIKQEDPEDTSGRSCKVQKAGAKVKQEPIDAQTPQANSPLPKSGWVFPKPRTSSAMKKLEWARVATTPSSCTPTSNAPTPIAVVSSAGSTSRTMTGSIKRKEMTTLVVSSTPGGFVHTVQRSKKHKRSSEKRTVAITPLPQALEVVVASRKRQPHSRSMNGRFAKKVKTESPHTPAFKSSASRSAYGRIEHSMSSPAASYAFPADDKTGTATTPNLSSTMIATFLSSPPDAEMATGLVPSPIVSVATSTTMTGSAPARDNGIWGAAFQTRAFGSALTPSPIRVDPHKLATPIMANTERHLSPESRASKSVIATSAGRTVKFSPIDRKERGSDRQIKFNHTGEDKATPCSKYVASYTASYGVSPSSFTPASNEGSGGFSPATATALGDWLEENDDCGFEDASAAGGAALAARLKEA